MEAVYLDGTRGRLFAIYHAAAKDTRQGTGLVYLPPFAEEMNCSRRMAALQARRLAALGIDVLLLDPFGTGDSGGDFGEARWDIWQEDTRIALAWLGRRSGANLGLWGLRLGALLAAEVAATSTPHLSRLVLWHPVHKGSRFLTQFLRLRLAATLAAETGRETTKDLQARLAEGEALEIGGYLLAPELARAIASRQLSDLLQNRPPFRVDILEVGSGEALEPSAATQGLLTGLSPDHPIAAAQAVQGEAFWAIQEFTLAPRLLDATDALFAL